MWKLDLFWNVWGFRILVSSPDCVVKHAGRHWVQFCWWRWLRKKWRWCRWKPPQVIVALSLYRITCFVLSVKLLIILVTLIIILKSTTTALWFQKNYYLFTVSKAYSTASVAVAIKRKSSKNNSSRQEKKLKTDLKSNTRQYQASTHQ